MLYICSEIVVFGRKNALYDSGKIVFGREKMINN